MKKLLLIASLFLSFCAGAQIDKVIPARPSPPKLVNDFTHTLTDAQREALEAKLVAYDDSTSNQIAVVLIPTLDGNSIEDVALEIMRRWGVGSKDKNNGVVLLIAKNDRKLRIEVGYGLEGAIPDLTARSIIDNELTPNFKEGNYYRGIDEATDALIKAAAGEYKAPAGYGKKSKKPSWLTIVIVLFVLMAIFGGVGGSGGTQTTRSGSRGMGGFPWWMIGGGGWSGGGGGSSGGGFGGFGGGGGGGGGASGNW